DFWDGMDYEIGTKPPGAAYWQAIERGETPQPKREDNARSYAVRVNAGNIKVSYFSGGESNDGNPDVPLHDSPHVSADQS
ncbi:MAG: hypothetical protein LC742_01285, partial [Acidobacteria bacterium]|nr:hypothetical protein [Acidobacteriota bacterium]